jgi:hypothetical protein
MRMPSSYRDLFGWWEDAVAGKNPERHEGEPQCGFYRMRMVRGGPWVPVRIYVDRTIDPETGELTSREIMRMEVAGEPGGDPARRWSYLTPISRPEYARLIEARKTDPTMRATHAPVDLTSSPVRP